MKKLLILATIIVAGIAANAASFKWSAANIYGSDATTKFTGTASLYAYAATADASTATVVSTASVTSGVIAATTFSSDSLAGGSYFNFYFVIEDGDKTFTSAEKANVLASATQTQNVAFGNMASQTQASGAWQSVPEPTSGLLLLLGMAGLALKRKRA